MISVSLKGGLANQMFQIAMLSALAWDHKDDFAVNFNVTCVNQGGPPYYYKDNIFKNVKQLPEGWEATAIYHESEGKPYIPLPYYDGLLLDGYFQDEIYFRGYSDAILRLFRHEDLIDSVCMKYKKYFMPLEETVSIHVRRGDYLKYPEVYNILDKNYYYKALSYISERVSVDNVLVFSDDVPWCKDNFPKDYIFVDGVKDWEAMYLMSLCNHNIIANSSFSWWGTYLNANESKIVVAPKQWDKNNVYQSIYTENMIKI